MKMIIRTLAVLFALFSSTARADLCDEFANQPEKYFNVKSGLIAVAMARVCVSQHVSKATSDSEHRTAIEEELKKDPQNLPLLRLRAKTIKSENLNKSLAKKLQEKADRIQKNIEKGSLSPPRTPSSEHRYKNAAAYGGIFNIFVPKILSRATIEYISQSPCAL